MEKGSISRLFSDIAIFGIILYSAYCNIPEEASVGAHSMTAKVIAAIIIIVIIFLLDNYTLKKEKNKQDGERKKKIQRVIMYVLIYLLVLAFFGLYCFNVI